MPALEAGDRRRETLAARQQLGHEPPRHARPMSGSSQPVKERMRRGFIASDTRRELALDARLGIGAVPHDDDLRLAGQKLFDAVELGARALQFGGEFALACPRSGGASSADRQHAQRADEDQRGQQRPAPVRRRIDPAAAARAGVARQMTAAGASARPPARTPPRKRPIAPVEIAKASRPRAKRPRRAPPGARSAIRPRLRSRRESDPLRITQSHGEKVVNHVTAARAWFVAISPDLAAFHAIDRDILFERRQRVRNATPSIIFTRLSAPGPEYP